MDPSFLDGLLYDGEWVLLVDVNVTNHSEWEKNVLDLPVSGDVKLAFGGSLSRSASLFLDDIKIYKKEETAADIREYKTRICDKEHTGTYTLMGTPVTQETMRSHPGIYIQNGRKIIIIR